MLVVIVILMLVVVLCSTGVDGGGVVVRCGCGGVIVAVKLRLIVSIAFAVVFGAPGVGKSLCLS